MYCPNCKREINDDRTFCYYCGVKVNASMPTNPSEQSWNSASTQMSAGFSRPTSSEGSYAPVKPSKNIGIIIVLTVSAVLIVFAVATGLYAMANGGKSLPFIGGLFSSRNQDHGDPSMTELKNMTDTDSKTENPAKDSINVQSGSEGVPPTDIIPQQADSPVKATSEDVNHPVANIVDENNANAWSCANGDGAGESLKISFGSEIEMYGIYIKNGYWISQYEMIRNNRAKRIVVSFSDGNSEVFDLSDPIVSNFAQLTTSEGQKLIFTTPHKTSYVDVAILDVYEGAENKLFITGVTAMLTPEAAPNLSNNMNTNNTNANNTSGPNNAGDSNQYDISGGDFILPYSSVRALTKSDLNGLTKEQLRLARNEIFARYGRQFNDASLRDYFNSKQWYQLIPKLPLGTTPTLSSLEQSNVELIQSYEEGNVSSNQNSNQAANQNSGQTSGQPLPISNSDYILPYSSERALTSSDLAGLSKDELKLARNEIYARYGRQFNDNLLKDYFNSKQWYQRIPKLAVGVEPKITKLEQSNVDFIKSYEEGNVSSNQITAQTPAQPPPVSNSDYIMSYSSDRALTNSDLSGLTKDELKLARNEIYARYGRQFNDDLLKDYFNSKEWYQRIPKLAVGAEPKLTKLEQSNVDFIKAYEEKLP